MSQALFPTSFHAPQRLHAALRVSLTLMLRNAFTPPCGFDLATTTISTATGLAAIAYWGFRVVTHPDGTCFVHETYYDAREGLLGIARQPGRPCGATTADVHDALARMAEGLAEAPIRFLDFAEDDAPLNVN